MTENKSEKNRSTNRSTNKSTNKIWVVRHGLRIDFTTPEWVRSAVNPYNPPLDPKGLEQASETAERLLSKNIDFIFASPFLRTLQTAEIIAEKTGIKINVEEGFSEWLKESEFKYKPDLNNLNSLNKDFPFINTDYKSIVTQSYPETREDLDTRTEKALLSIIEKYGSNILIISHGSPIKSIYKSLINKIPDEYQPMCSVTRFEYSSGDWKISIDGDSTHLTTPDITHRAFYTALK